MNKISCFAVSKITNAVKGNKSGNQNNDENHDYTNSVSGNGRTGKESNGGTPLLKRNSKVSSVPDIEVIQEVMPSSQNPHEVLAHHMSINPIQNPNYVNHVYLQHHQQLSQPSSPMLPPSQMSHHRNYNNQHYKISAPSSPQLTPRCNNFFPFPTVNYSSNATPTGINEMLNMKHRQHGSRTSIPPSSPSLSHHTSCKSPSRQRKMIHPYSNEVMNGYSTMEVQNAALGALKEEVIDLASKVKHFAKERDYLEKELNASQLEKLRICRDRDDILDNQSLRYEERLVELHSVIAELSRQLEQKARERIIEEDDDLDVENDADTSCENNSDTYQETSGKSCNSKATTEKPSENSHAASKSDVLSRTSTDVIDAEAIEAGNRLAEHLDGGDLCAFLKLSRSVSRSITHSSTTSLQVLALQEELSDTKERNIQLASRLQQKERDLDETRKNVESLTKDKEKLRDKISEMEEEKLQMTPALSPRKSSAVPLSPGIERKTSKEFDRTGKDDFLSSIFPGTTEEDDDMNLLRMAERKKIRKMEDVDSNDGHHHQVTGSELSSVGVRNSVVVEHLVQDIQDKSAMQEFSHSFTSPSFTSLNGNNVNGNEEGGGRQTENDKNAIHRRSVVESKLQEFEIEMERLSSRIEHLRSQNEVLNLSLEESKNQCDNLTVLIGKYESNHTAEQLTINYADHIIEALETLVSLIESEVAVTVANCRTGKLSNDQIITKSFINNYELTEKELLYRANEGRLLAENKAKKLLSKLESFARPDSGIVSAPESAHNVFVAGTTNSASTSVWEESSGYSQNTGSVCTSSESNKSGPATSNTSIASSGFIFSYKAEVQHQLNFYDTSMRTDEVKLKDFISQLKKARSSVKSTINTDLESMHAEDSGPIRNNVNDNRTADLEMAVLVQELMAMREEKADLRGKVYIMEKEKKSLELTISTLNAQEMAMKTHIQHLQDELENQDNLEVESQSSYPQRSDELKDRITELLTTLEKVKRNSELKQQQADELIFDLKRNNSALVDSLEKTKKKYQSRLKRMEQQILQHLLHNQLTDPSDSQIDNDSIDRIEAEANGETDATKASDLVTSWIPTTGSVLSLISSESDHISD